MSNTIIAHQYKNFEIDQFTQNTQIGNQTISKGFVNASQICKANGKKLNDWTRLKSSSSYLEALSADTGIPVSALTIEIKGGGSGKGATEQGTWVHPEVAIAIASWISPQFQVWANRVLRYAIDGNIRGLNQEAEQAIAELTKQWQKTRNLGKATRRKLTDSIKDWYAANPRATTRPLGVMIAQTTNLVYQALWGMDAQQLEQHLKCDRHTIRNTLNEIDLCHLERAEATIIDLIDEDNIKPVDAVVLANIRRRKQLPQN